MLTNWGDLLTNVPSNGGGAAIAPADYAGTLTVANQAARLALVYGTGTGQVQELDQVFQTSDSTLWVLLASDPSVSGNWSRLPGNDASVLTTGTLPAARYTSSPTTNNVLKWDGTQLVDSGITDSSSTGYVALNGRALDLSNGANPGSGIYGIGVMAGTLKLQTVTAIANFCGATCYSHLTSAGLAVNKGTSAASKMLEVVDSAAAQLRLTHTAGTYYTDFLSRFDGTLEIRPSGGITAVLHTLRIYEANLLNQADISCGATGRLLFGSNPVIPTATPSSASATGIAGEVAWDGSYIYIATATNAWKRVAIATW